MNTIIQGDCLESLKKLEDNSIDAIVTDPPYGLSFMGKRWDYDVPSVEIWEECLRVLKPGGYLLSFAGTRTQHRMAVRIEDAGFEIRDMIAWVYGSGFPKSLNIGKAVDKLQGNEREVVGTQMLGGNAAQTTKEKGGTYASNTNAVGVKPIEVTLTKGTSEWEGWGTSLKPALEPITVARKPIEGNVAQNCLKWGVGGINIDGCRVGTEEMDTSKNRRDTKTTKDLTWVMGKDGGGEIKIGRFPANLIHDGSDEVKECFPESKSSNAVRKNKVKTGLNGIYNEYEAQDSFGFNDSGNASRFFYCAKASKSERNKGCEGLEVSEKFTAGNYSQSPTCKDCNLTLNGTNDHSKCSGEVYYKEMESKNTKNHHPTVKPIALMEYLVKLVSKKGHTVLDPFSGSGSTLIACKKLKRNYIGMELDPEYIKIAEARLNSIKEENTLF